MICDGCLATWIAATLAYLVYEIFKVIEED